MAHNLRKLSLLFQHQHLTTQYNKISQRVRYLCLWRCLWCPKNATPQPIFHRMVWKNFKALSCPKKLFITTGLSAGFPHGCKFNPKTEIVMKILLPNFINFYPSLLNPNPCSAAIIRLNTCYIWTSLYEL